MQLYHNSFFSMGTRFNAVFAHPDQYTCDEVFQSIYTEILRIEGRLSYFDKSSDLSRINETACKQFVPLDDELFEIISTCVDYSTLTSGSYDVTMRYLHETGKTEAYRPKTVKEKILIDKTNKSLKLADENIKIDLGGYGKGYALQQVQKIIAQTKIENGIISFGESSVWAWGKHPAGKDWRLGIKDLYNQGKSVTEIDLYNKSVSISSNYFTSDDGKLINKKHIINPKEAAIGNDVKITAVISESPVQAEILSTAFMNMKDEEIKNTLAGFAGVEALLIKYNNNKAEIKQI